MLSTFPVRPEGELLTVQELHVVAGREEEFVARFAELDVLRLAAEAAGGELVDASLVQEGARFLVVTSWASSAGIEAWIASPARELVRESWSPSMSGPRRSAATRSASATHPTDGRAHREQRKRSDQQADN